MANNGPRRETLEDIAKQNREWFKTHQHKGSNATYRTYWKQFVTFCEEKKQQYLPADPHMVAYFMRHLTQHSVRNPNKGLARGTINNVVIAAIAEAHVLAGYDSPTTNPFINKAKRTVIEVTPPPNTKNPLTVNHFLRMFEKVNINSFIDVRDYFLLLIMFLAILRRTEAMHLRLSDVYQVELTPGHWILVVWVGTSEATKTDRGRKGEYMLVDSNPRDVRLCPLQWHTLYLDARRNWHRGQSTYLFVDARQTHRRAKTALKGEVANIRLKKRAQAIGEPIDEFSSGACRHGGATAIAAAGVPSRILKRHGRWKSDAYMVYVHESLANRLTASRAILDSNEPTQEVKIARPQ